MTHVTCYISLASKGGIVLNKLDSIKLKLQSLLTKYSHAWVFLYIPIYCVWFTRLEQDTTLKFSNVHSVLDNYIPFCEYFVIPYVLWFLYVGLTVGILFFQTKHKEDFYKCFTLLVFGMTIALIAYSFFPSVQHLRPNPMPRYNFFTRIVTFIYATDTPTNVCPSIHVFNALAVHIAITHSHFFRDKKKIQIASLVFCILICISTVTLKQHSILDGVVSIGLILLLYPIVYKPGILWQEQPATTKP